MNERKEERKVLPSSLSAYLLHFRAVQCSAAYLSASYQLAELLLLLYLVLSCLILSLVKRPGRGDPGISFPPASPPNEFYSMILFLSWSRFVAAEVWSLVGC